MRITLLHLTAGICALLQFSLFADERVFQNGLNGYNEAEDATLRGEPEEIRSNNYGRDPVLEVQGVPWGGARRLSLIRFKDIVGAAAHQIPPGSEVNSATLELYRVGGAADSGQYDAEPAFAKTITVYPMLVDYQCGDGREQRPVDGAVCFSLRSYSIEMPSYWGNMRTLENGPVAKIDFDESEGVSAPFKPDEKDLWMSWDVTKIAVQWISNPEKNYGLLMMTHGFWIGVDLASSEAHEAEFHPKLTIIFTPPAKKK